MYICGDERLSGYDLLNAVGRLTDTTIAMARLFHIDCGCHGGR